jgi:AraC family transcriptional regulator, regulatory protein of adaptative response / methylated-DNA-[protein]-cysteine methyltransferase
MTDDAFVDSRDFARVARAIGYIQDNFQRQPRLATIAGCAQLSEFHFNRLFRRWAGVTPRQYLAFVTAHAAREALERNPSVLDAAYSLGLSGPGRLHDLLVTLEGVTPGELKGGGRDVQLTYGFGDTPFGRALLAVSPRGLSHLAFLEAGGERTALAELAAAWPNAALTEDPAAIAELIGRIFAHAGSGARQALRLTVKGTNFQLKVWRALLELGARGPTSYSELARAIGMPDGARAVANAVGANPVAWLIPCHNVLRKDGTLGGYRFGTDRKRAMLAWSALHGAQQRAAAAAGSG